jgi:hypothetical protein
VINCIRREKSKSRRQKMLIRAPLLAGIAACAALIVLKSTAWSEPGEALSDLHRVLLWIAVSMLGFSLAAFIAWFVKMRGNVARIVKGMTVPAERKGDIALKTFRDALDAVAIGAGISAPRILVAGLPTVNALPVFLEGEPHVAVTEEALRAGLSYREAEAMMAQVLSRIMLGHVWGTPVILRSGLLPFFLLGMLAFLVVITLLVYIPGKADQPVIVFLTVIAMFWMLGPAGRYLFGHGDLACAHADALADSIAVKITGDPAGMKALIEKLAAETGEAVYTLQLQYVSRYLFLCPPGAAAPSGEPPGEGTALAREDAFRRVLVKTIAYANTSLRLRIENLEMIENGRWSAFED